MKNIIISFKAKLRNISSKKGFTLINLLLVFAIIGILSSSFWIISGQNSQKQARDSIRKTNLKAIAVALEDYQIKDVFDFDNTAFVFPPNSTTYPDNIPNGWETYSDPVNGDIWIPGLEPFVKDLPQDPKQSGILNQLAILFNSIFDTNYLKSPQITNEIYAQSVLALNNFTGFETGGLEEGDDNNLPVIDGSDPKHSGDYSLKLYGNASQPEYSLEAFELGSVGDQGDDLIVGFYFQTDSINPSADVDFFCGCRFTGLTPHIGLRLTTAGQLVLFDEGEFMVDSQPAPFATGEWHLIEMRWQNLQLGEAEVFVDGISVLTATADFLIESRPFGDPGSPMDGEYTWRGSQTVGETIFIDDVYAYSGSSGGTADFLGGIEVFAYQNTTAGSQDQGQALDAGLWANVGETPGNNANEAVYDTNTSGSTVTNDGGLRSGPAGDLRLGDGDGTFKGAKWIHRRKYTTGGQGKIDYNLIGNTGDGLVTIDINADIAPNYRNFYYISEATTEVPLFTEYFQYGFAKSGSGGQTTHAAEIWAMILHVPSGGPPPPPTADIKADDSDGPIEVTSGTDVTISWSYTDSGCLVSPGGWTITESPKIVNITTATTYAINCDSSSDSVTVNIAGGFAGGPCYYYYWVPTNRDKFTLWACLEFDYDVHIWTDPNADCKGLNIPPPDARYNFCIESI